MDIKLSVSNLLSKQLNVDDCISNHVLYSMCTLLCLSMCLSKRAFISVHLHVCYRVSNNIRYKLVYLCVCPSVSLSLYLKVSLPVSVY